MFCCAVKSLCKRVQENATDIYNSVTDYKTVRDLEE